MIKSKQTEKEFDNFFETTGYKRVSEDVGESPSFKNADYVNKSRRIIVELKVLEKEKFSEGGVINSMNALIFQPKNIDEQGYGQYSFTIPDLNRKNKHDVFEEPLRLKLKEANRQIRETKAYYSHDDSFTGYVVLAQTGLISLSPEITAKVVLNIWNEEFRSIDGFIICTPHSIKINPLTCQPNTACVSVTNNNIQKLRSQCMEIADSWCDFFDNGGHSIDSN